MYLNMSRIFKFFSFSRPDYFRSWVSNKIDLQLYCIRLSYLNKHPDTALIVLGTFPKAFFRGNFPNVQYKP